MTGKRAVGPQGFDAILFDMDGVLVDSEPAHEAATNEIAIAAGLGPIPPEIFACYFFGRTDYLGFQSYLAAAGRTDLAIDELMRLTADAFARRFATDVQPLADGLGLLRRSVDRGYLAAIVSGARASEIEMVIERFSLAALIAATVSGDDIPNGKPHPGPYLAGAERLGVASERCLVIEDAPSGIASAIAAGMRCLAVDRLNQPARLAQADRVVTRLSIQTVLEMDAMARQ